MHRIWIGPHRIPPAYVAHAVQWEALGYPVHDWSLLELRKLPVSEATAVVIADIEERGANAGGGIDRTATWVQLADVYSYELVRCLGGIYANTDIEPLRALPLDGLDAFVVGEDTRFLSNALMGAEAGHPFFEDVCAELPASFWAKRWEPMNQSTGPHLLTARWEATGQQVARLEPCPFMNSFNDEGRYTADETRQRCIDAGMYVAHFWGHKHPELLED